MRKDGHLFLSVTGAGGKYEFEPLRGSKAQTAKSPVLSADLSNLRVGKLEAATFWRTTHYDTQPGLLIIERGGETRPAFQVRSGSGARYVGEDITFWEWHGEATVNWSGTQLQCRRR